MTDTSGDPYEIESELGPDGPVEVGDTAEGPDDDTDTDDKSDASE
ncbi:hypothetical protein SCB71_07720 [Herbiconiux sp. KACC 21604]|nr:hypothetical protein [Herbiconiux sp. SALV-R1]WPO88114.1 hypothetical protein SCB71_07720 [Herbiconiux sp. KACC 21604]